MKYTEGVCEDGAVILRDGEPIPVHDVVDLLNRCSVKFHEDATGQELIAACRKHRPSFDDASRLEKNNRIAMMDWYWRSIWESLYEPQTQETKDG